MNSYDNLNNFKYLGKIAVIMLIIFLILKYAINLRQVEAVLLSAIIAVSILIIENIIFINNEASDPLNCDQCKVQQVKEINPNSTSNITQSTENFGIIDDLQKDIKNITNTVLVNNENFQNVEKKHNIQDVRHNRQEDRLDVRHDKQEDRQEIRHDRRDERQEDRHDRRDDRRDIIHNIISENIKHTDGSSETLDSYIDEQADKNIALIQDKYIEKTNMPTQLRTGYPENTTFEPKPSGQILSQIKDVNKFKEDVKNEYKSLLQDQNKDFIDNQISSMNLNDLTVKNTIPKGDPIQGPSVSFDESYVQYQNNGLQKLDELDALKTNIFRASIGDQQVVQEYLQDGVKYNDRIYSYSTDAPKTYEALNSELKYGDYNYIGPLNKGMINKAYTFINPTNWYPIPPFPPVCVTNKSCTTCPIQMNDGNNYMNFASLEDFDKARRFTGDMRINVDYIKNVLNNPNGY